MGGAPYFGPRLGDGPIFEVSVSQLDVKEHPGNYPRDLHVSNWFQSYLSMVTNREQGWPIIEPILHCVLLMAAILSGCDYDQ